jgi:hypothetical protein
MHNPPMIFPRLACLAAAAALSILATGCNGSSDDRPATWSFISATITEPSCATVNCHSAITHQGGVDLSSRQAGYQALVGNNGDGGFLTYYVFPGNSQQSPVVKLMNAVGSIRMPPDNPLPEADIQLIEAWINQGALDN